MYLSTQTDVCSKQLQPRLLDCLGFNGTFSTHRLYHAFEKYVAVKKVKLITQLRKHLTAFESKKPNSFFKCGINSRNIQLLCYCCAVQLCLNLKKVFEKCKNTAKN